jgi:hypothetical protein
MSFSWYGADPLPLESRLPIPALIESLRDAMAEIGHPMDPCSVRPITAPRASLDELSSAAAALVRLLRRALLESAPTSAGRVAALGADPDDYPLFIDGPAEEEYAACMARPDVVVDASGPKFIEFNLGAGVSGVTESSVNSAAWIHAFGGAGQAPFDGFDPLAGRAGVVARAVRELGADPAVAIVGTARDLKVRGSTYFFDVQIAAMKRTGLTAEFFEPEDLLSGLGLPGRPRYQVGLRHFTIPEMRGHGVDLAPMRAALDAGCTLLATQTAHVISNKKVMAWVSEGRPWMTADDRETVEQYLPWTREVGDRPVRWRGATRPLPELLVDRQEEFVLKPAVGMQSQRVVAGRDCDPGPWRKLVADAVSTGDFVVQELVESVAYLMEFAHGDGPETYEAEVFPVLSPFVFDGRPGGCMARYLPPGRRGLVSVGSHGALPTVVLARR